MRIIAGEFRGRRLKLPRGHRMRPTAERVREAWFSILGASLNDATVIDLFAGSGALGFEALSRGARRVDFVERAKGAVAALEGNITLLGVAGRTTVHQVDAVRFLNRVQDAAYDIALADPPYRSTQAALLLRRFRERPFARILGVEHRSAVPLPGDETRRYGDIALTFCYA